jgi:predicted MFS family arabinose efflux permease
MPLIGLTAQLGWRVTWIGLPLVAAAAAFVAAADPPAEGAAVESVAAPRRRGDPAIAGWALGELFAYAGWGGGLVYAASMLVVSYNLSPGTVGLLLGGTALAAFPGNFIVRRWLPHRSRELLVLLGLASATLVLAFYALRPGLAGSVVLFTLLVFVACSRAVVSNAFALRVGPERALAAMGVRSCTGQFGYLLGAGLGGLALAAGGFAHLGVVLALLLTLGAAPHAAALIAERAPSGRLSTAPSS